MQRTDIVKTVAAAVVLAAVSGAAVVGCRGLYPAPAADAARALADGAGGVQAIAAQTQIAEKQVRKALPHSDVAGQAYLESASDAHAAVLASNTRVESALVDAGQQVQRLREELTAAAEQLRQEQEKFSQLERQWYVAWGQRIERWLWTAAVTWLLASAGSLALGTGNPLAWIGRLRNLIAATRQRWIGEAFVK